MAGTQDIPGWSSQNLVQATQGGIYFGGANKDQSQGLAGMSSAMRPLPQMLGMAALASAAGVLFTLV